MNYNNLLKSPKWQKRRLEIFERDNFTCTLCGDKETELHAHHKYYEKGLNPWEHSDECLITVCKHCHLEIHKIKDKNVVEIDYANLKSLKISNVSNSYLIYFSINKLIHFSDYYMGEEVCSYFLYDTSKNKILEFLKNY